MSRTAVLIGVLAVLVAGAGCGGDDDNEQSTSPAALKSRLVPPAELRGFKLERNFEWTNAIDFVAEGLPLPQSTRHSTAVAQVEDAGFDAGAGEHLRQGPGVGLTLLAAKFDSDEDAQKILEYAHKEGLKQPCFAACSEDPGSFKVPGIPGARGAQQLPAKNPPKDAPPPFIAYGVGFRIGPYFYLVMGDGPTPDEGPPGARTVERSQVVKVAQAQYRRAKRAGSG